MKYVKIAAVKFGVLREIWKLILVCEGDLFSNINFSHFKY